MTTKIDLKQLIVDTLSALKASGGSKAVIEYLSPHIEGITIQKVNGWMKTGKFPFEVSEAIFANEAKNVEPPQATARSPVEPQFTKEQVTDANPAASSDFSDPNTEETLPGNLVGDDAYTPRHPKTGVPVQLARPVAPQPGQGRAPDIRIRERGERGRPPEPAMVQPPADELDQRITRIVVGVLQQAGLIAPQPVVGSGAQANGPGPADGRRVRQGDLWNRPKQPQFVVQPR